MHDNTITFDLPGAPLLLRAIHLADTDVDLGTGHTAPDGAWMWFVGSRERDQWVAHGLSDAATPTIARAAAASTDAFLVDALIAYIGEPWAHIAIMPIAFGQLQRTYICTLTDADRARLLRTPGDVLAQRRAVEEDDLFSPTRGRTCQVDGTTDDRSA
jgi:hypothetical protein